MTSHVSLWSQVQLGKILSYVDPLVELDDEIEYTTITVKRRHGGLEAREKLLGSQIRTKKQYKLVPGSFIISRIQCWHQAYAIVPDNTEPNIIASTNYDQFIISSEVDKRFFWWLSYSPMFTEIVRSCAFGVVIEKMVFNRNAWLDKTIFLPSLQEQQRIVARIDELVAKIDKAQEVQRKTVETTEGLLSSVLKSLFDSGSTKKWPSQRLIENNLATVIAGQHIMAEEYNSSGDGFPYITGPADFGFKVPEIKHWTLVPKSIAKPGDILLTVKGAGVGKINFAPDVEVAIGRQIMAIRPDNSHLLQEFVYFFLEHKFEYFQSIATATTVPGFKKKNVEELPIPVPPLSDQHRVVAYLDDLQAKVNALKHVQANASTNLNAKLPYILDKAFKGEL